MNIDNRIKFRHLAYFMEVARQGSLAAAAEVLSVTQPAVSKAIKELELMLEAELFIRAHNGVTLSEAGKAFMRYAGPCIQSLREGVRSLRAGEHSVGQVRVGVLSTVESYLLPDTLRRLHTEHAALTVQVLTGSAQHLLSQLRVGDLDLVVGRMADNPHVHGMSFEHLYTDAMVLVVRRGHPLLEGGRAELDAYPIVLPLPETSIRRHADSLFVQLGISLPLRRVETLSVALCRNYVLSGDAIWVAPLDAVHQDLYQGDMAALDLGFREPGGSVGICTNPTLPLSLAAQWCCEALRAASRSYQAGQT